MKRKTKIAKMRDSNAEKLYCYSCIDCNGKLYGEININERFRVLLRRSIDKYAVEWSNWKDKLNDRYGINAIIYDRIKIRKP